METEDLKQLSTEERMRLDASFLPEERDNREGYTVATSVAAITTGLLVAVWTQSVALVTAFAVLVVIVTGIEKIRYTRLVGRYESIIRKLVHRLEQLEGSELSPLGSLPAQAAERRARKREAA